MSERPLFKLTLIQNSAASRVFELSQTTYSLGREHDNDIVLEMPGISRRHIRLFRQGEAYSLEDLGSSNGSFVNGQRVAGSRPLAPGDTIRLGSSVELKYASLTPIVEPNVAAPPPARAATPAAAPEFAPTVAVEALDTASGRPKQPPQFVVEEASRGVQTHHLTAAFYTVGRADGNTILLSSPLASRHHFRLQKTQSGYELVPLSDAGNAVYLQGKLVSGSRPLEHGDVMRIGGRDPGTMISFRYLDPAAAQPVTNVSFGERTVLTLGRDPTNDIQLDAPQVSRYHAQLEKVGARYRVRDLRSVNGTFVNGQRLQGEAWLTDTDQLRIGSYRFVLGADGFSQYDDSGGLRLEASGLNKWVRRNLNILQNISLVFQPKEFVVVVGQSGGGKSTLVDAIAGYRPATQGRVLVNGLDLYRHFDSIRSNIGFVPQKDIIHMELTVEQALDYAAQLRMLPDTTPAERRTRLKEVLEELDLSHRAGVQISGLSGGQQKRVSIGVELLTKPGLFFLDEPTSGLDPSTETALMYLMRRMADQGRTILLITHATKNVMLADKVVFLARGGYLAWFGPPDEALKYFDQYRSERERRAGEMEFDQIYQVLDNPSHGTAPDWGKRFLSHAAYQKYIAGPLGQSQAGSPAGAAIPARPAPRRRQVSALRQFLILSARNLKILTRDRFSLMLMLSIAPLIASLDIVISVLIGRNQFDFNSGSASRAITSLFLMAIYAVMVGSLSQMREIVKEHDIYKRERLVNLKIIPYISSKVWVAGLLAVYQAAWYVLIHYLAFSMPGGILEFGLIYITMALAAMTGMMLGLFASAISPNANSVPLIVLILMLPQIVLGGALIPLPDGKDLVSVVTTTRWTYESLVTVTGLGSDVAGDYCWQLPKSEREALSEANKQVLGCQCLGANIFRSGSCDFPGIGQYYDPTIDQPEPIKPQEVTDAQPQLDLPEPPAAPADRQDPVAVSNYLDEMQAYQDDVDRIKAQYETDLEYYKDKQDTYQSDLERYSDDIRAWESERTKAIGQAEGVIGNIKDEFGWAFVDGDNLLFYLFKLTTRWMAQAVISMFLFVLILIVQKAKDRA